MGVLQDSFVINNIFKDRFMVRHTIVFLATTGEERMTAFNLAVSFARIPAVRTCSPKAEALEFN